MNNENSSEALAVDCMRDGEDDGEALAVDCMRDGEDDGVKKPTKNGKRGFASLSPERLREISAKGGQVARDMGVAHRWNSAQARVAGMLGGSSRAKQLAAKRNEASTEVA